MTPYVIPTIFVAVNQMHRPIDDIKKDLDGVGGKADKAGASIGDLVGGAAIGGAVAYAVGRIMSFQDELANLKALTGASGAEFEKYKDTIHQVAEQSKTSSVEVAKSFTVIANSMPELLKSADGLGKVTSASILLAQASRMKLEPAAESLTTILNQFSLGANDAKGAVDMMAAGSKYGSAEIEDLSATMTEFGAQAKLAGLSLQESIGITELVSKFRKGSQAGTELRNVLLAIDTVKVQDPKALADLNRLGVNLDLVSDKTVPIADRLLELKKIVKDDGALAHLFGKENLAMASAVLTNADALKPLINNIGETGVAASQAQANTSTLSARLGQLSGKLDNLLTEKEGNSAVEVLADSISYLTDNLGGILKVALPVIAAFGIWKTLLIANSVRLVVMNEAIVAYNFLQAAAAVWTGNLTGSMLTQKGAIQGASLALGNYNAAIGNTLRLSAALAIFAYRQEIEDTVNDTLGFMLFNHDLGRDDTVKEALERKYMKDPTVARNIIKQHPELNVAGIEKSFATIDSAKAGYKVHLGDGADKMLEGINMIKEQHESDSTFNANKSANIPPTNIVVTLGKGLEGKVISGDSTGIRTKQTGY